MNRFRRWTSNRRLRDIGDRIRRRFRRPRPPALEEAPSEVGEAIEEDVPEPQLEGKHAPQRVRFVEPLTEGERLRQRVIDRLVSMVVQGGNSNANTMRERAERISTDYIMLDYIQEENERQRLELYNSMIGVLTSNPETFDAFMNRLPEDRQQEFRSLRNTYMNIPSFLSTGNQYADLTRAIEFNRVGRNDLKVLLSLATFLIIGNAIYSFLDIEDEKHIPNSSNFNGAGTKVEDRVGITLDASSRIGTQPFHIPTDLNDLLASIHDFAYFENNNFDRMYADYVYWYNNAYPDTFLEKIQDYGLIKSKEDIKDIKEIWKTTDTRSGAMLGVASILRFLGIPENLESVLDPREVVYRTMIPAFYNYRNLLFPSYFNNYRSNPLSARTFALGMLPDWGSLGLSIAEKAKDASNFLLYGKPKEFNKYHNTTVEKWLKYLGSIGTFDKSGVFVLKAKGDKEEILKDYKDFIEEFNDMVRVSDYPDKIANTEFNEEQVEKITNPKRDEGSVKPSGLGFGTVLGWFDFDSWEDRFMYKNYGFDPNSTALPSPSPTEPPELPPIDWKNLSGDLVADIPVLPPRYPMTPAQPAPVTVTPSPTPTTTTTTTPSPTPTTTTPSPTPTTTTTTTTTTPTPVTGQQDDFLDMIPESFTLGQEQEDIEVPQDLIL